MVELQPETGKHHGGVGTINLHDRVIPVYSLWELLGLSDRPPLPTDVLIIASTSKDCVAIWADGVRGVRESPVQLPPEPGTSCFSGVLRGGEEEITIIHDLDAFLAAEKTAQYPLPPGVPETDSDGEVPPNTIETAGEILAERARILAQPEETRDETSFQELLAFRLAGQEYAIKTQYIREVFIMHEITPVPGVPEFIAGICAIRGEIIAIVDLRAFLSIPKHGLTDLNRIIVLTDGTMTFGILADYVTDIYIRSTEQFTPVGPEATSIKQRYLLGVTGESVLVLDAAAILADPALVIDQTRK